MDELYLAYGKQVEFFLVYIREAHPTDGRQTRSNIRAGIVIKQPKSFSERVAVADKMCSKLNLLMPPLIDGMDNKVNTAYNAFPDRLYLIGEDGKIAYKGGPGPRGFKPDELADAIKKELNP